MNSKSFFHSSPDITLVDDAWAVESQQPSSVAPLCSKMSQKNKSESMKNVSMEYPNYSRLDNSTRAAFLLESEPLATSSQNSHSQKEKAKKKVLKKREETKTTEKPLIQDTSQGTNGGNDRTNHSRATDHEQPSSSQLALFSNHSQQQHCNFGTGNNNIVSLDYVLLAQISGELQQLQDSHRQLQHAHQQLQSVHKESQLKVSHLEKELSKCKQRMSRLETDTSKCMKEQLKGVQPSEIDKLRAELTDLILQNKSKEADRVGTSESIQANKTIANRLTHSRPLAQGTLPRASGPNGRASHLRPIAQDTSPRANGSNGKASHSRPIAQDTSPRANGSNGKASHSRPIAQGTSPRANGSNGRASHSRPIAQGTSPRANGLNGRVYSRDRMVQINSNTNDRPKSKGFLDSIQTHQPKQYFNKRAHPHHQCSPIGPDKVHVRFMAKLPPPNRKRELFLRVRTATDRLFSQSDDFVEHKQKCSESFIKENLDEFTKLLFNGEGLKKYPGGVCVVLWHIEGKESFRVSGKFIDVIIEKLKSTEFPMRVVKPFFIQFANGSFSKQPLPEWPKNFDAIERRMNDKEMAVEIKGVVANRHVNHMKFGIKIVGNREQSKMNSFSFKKL